MLYLDQASRVAGSVVKNPSASTGDGGDPGSISFLEDPLEKEIATAQVFLPGQFHGQRSLAGYSPWGSQRTGHDRATERTHIYILSLRSPEHWPHQGEHRTV